VLLSIFILIDALPFFCGSSIGIGLGYIVVPKFVFDIVVHFDFNLATMSSSSILRCEFLAPDLKLDSVSEMLELLLAKIVLVLGLSLPSCPMTVFACFRSLIMSTCNLSECVISCLALCFRPVGDLEDIGIRLTSSTFELPMTIVFRLVAIR
jgi:hypothetical protein